MWEGVRVSVQGGEQFAWAAFGRQGGVSRVAGLCAEGLCGLLGGVVVPWGVGLLAAGVCGLLGEGGGERQLAGGVYLSMAGFCGCSRGTGKARVAGPGAVRVGWRVWAMGGEWVRREGQGVWDCVSVRCVGIRVRLQRCISVVSCRPRSWEEELAVFCGRGDYFADAFAYFVYLLVGGGKRVSQAWARAHAPENPVDGLVPAGEGALWSGATAVCAHCVWSACVLLSHAYVCPLHPPCKTRHTHGGIDKTSMGSKRAGCCSPPFIELLWGGLLWCTIYLCGTR